MRREFDSNLSGNEVYCTNSSTLLVKNMLCSQLHYHKRINPILFSDQMLVNLKGLGPLGEHRAAQGLVLELLDVDRHAHLPHALHGRASVSERDIY